MITIQRVSMIKYLYSPIDQRNLYQNPSWILSRNGKADPKIGMETQGAQNSQTILEKEEQRWRIHTLQFQNITKQKQLR